MKHMVSRRWMEPVLFCIALVCVAGQAFAASSPGDVVQTITAEQAESPAVQTQIINALAAEVGGSASEFRLVLTQSSGGAFIPAVVGAVDAAGYDTESKTSLLNLLNGGAVGSKTASASQVIAGLNIATGVSALAGANAATNVVSAIGGGGGVVATRQDAVMAERRGMVEQFGSNTALASSAMNADLVNRIWFSPFYTRQNGDKNGVNEAYDFKASGVSLGYDHSFGSFTVGTALTYSSGDYDVKDVEDDNSIDSYGFSLYGQYYNASNGFFATISGGYTYSDNDYNRYDSINRKWQRGANHTDSYWFGANVGKDFTLNTGMSNKLILTPSIGLFWSDSTGSAYNSRGVINQVIGEMETQSVMLPIDVAARYVHEINDCSSVTFKVSGGYSYNFKNDGSKGTMRYDYAGADTISVNGTAPGRSSWNVGTGVKYQYKSMDFGVDYRYDGRKKFDAHRVSATIGLNF